MVVCLAIVMCDRAAREVGRHVATRRRPARKKASAAAKRSGCCGRRATCRSSRWSSPSARWRRTSSISRSTWRSAEFKGAGNTDAIAAFLGQLIVYLSLIGFVIQVDADQPHPPRARHRLRAADAAGQHGRRGGAHPVQPRAVGAERRPHHRHVDPLHHRQDVARSAVPAAAGRPEVPRQAVHRRDDGSVRQGRGRGADAGAASRTGASASTGSS